MCVYSPSPSGTHHGPRLLGALSRHHALRVAHRLGAVQGARKTGARKTDGLGPPGGGCVVLSPSVLSIRCPRSCPRSSLTLYLPTHLRLILRLILPTHLPQVISWILLIWLCGSWLVFFVARVLGSDDVTYSSALAVIGYSVLPLIVAVFILIVFGALVGSPRWLSIIVQGAGEARYIDYTKTRVLCSVAKYVH